MEKLSQNFQGRKFSGRAALQHAWMQSKGTITLYLIYSCIGMFIITLLSRLFALKQCTDAIHYFALSYDGLFIHGWLHQLVTAPLMHLGILNLLFNMFALWMLGPRVEWALGKGRYLRFLIVCTGAVMAAHLALTCKSDQLFLGTSGVVFAILTAQAVFFPNDEILLFFFPTRIKYAVLIIAGVVLYMSIGPEGGTIANASSLAGAAAALAFLRGRKLLGMIGGK